MASTDTLLDCSWLIAILAHVSGENALEQIFCAVSLPRLERLVATEGDWIGGAWLKCSTDICSQSYCVGIT